MTESATIIHRYWHYSNALRDEGVSCSNRCNHLQSAAADLEREAR